MTLTLQFSVETGQKLRDEAARRGVTVEEYVRQLAEQSVSTGAVASDATADAKRALWREWVASHQALPYLVDDSRESIYEGRGE